MDLPPCVLLAEAMRLDVGRGVAVVDIEAVVARSKEGCALDLRAVLLAREEGRDPPELVAFRGDLGKRELTAKGPLGSAILALPSTGGRARLRAVLRGERFVAVSLGIDRSLVRNAFPFRAVATSTWGSVGIAAHATWVDHGVPVMVTVDPGRDREPLVLSSSVLEDRLRALVVDAGPALGGDEPPSTPEEREAQFAAGGVRAVTMLLTDLPLAVATAKDDARSLDRLREAARLALAASSSNDPIFASLGQRLATAIASGFSSCKRNGETSVPSGWPPLRRDLAQSGVLEDEAAGCPRLVTLLSANHSALHFGREGQAALREALFAVEKAKLPTVGPLTPPVGPLGKSFSPSVGRGRRARVVLVIGAVLLALLVLARRAWTR